MSKSQIDPRFYKIAGDFNNTLLSLSDNFALVMPDSLVGENIAWIRDIINEEENRYEYVKYFVFNILQFKDMIDKGDEEFFLKKSYDKELEGASGMINKVFEFKSIWKSLSTSNKKIFVQYMQILSALAQEFFKVLDEYNFKVKF